MRPARGIAFPGQGGNWSATVRRLADHPDHPLVRALRERLRTDPADLDGHDTRHAQPAVYVASLVTAPADADVVVGHSLGEITAATWAGAIDPVTGLDLLVTRAELGHRAHTDRAGAMAAVNRWDRSRVELLRREAQFRSTATLDIAVINSETQIVLSGDSEAVDVAVELANDRGAVARRLPIGGAYHSTLLVGVTAAFGEAVRAAVTADPTVPIVSSTTGEILRDAEAVITALTGALVASVDWPRAMAAVDGTGVTSLIDAGPGDTLVRLGRHVDGPPTIRP